MRTLLFLIFLTPFADAATLFDASGRADAWIRDTQGHVYAYSLDEWSDEADVSGNRIRVRARSGTEHDVATLDDPAMVTVNALEGSYPRPRTAVFASASIVGLGMAERIAGEDPTDPKLIVAPGGGTFDDTVAIDITLSAAQGRYTLLWHFDDDATKTHPFAPMEGNRSLRIHLGSAGTHILHYGLQGGDMLRAQYTIDNSDTKRDSDGDGLPDLWEIAHGLDPFDADLGVDSDGNGWSDFDEILRDFNLTDSDGDGWTDWDERLRRTDPFNASGCIDKPAADTLYGVEYNVTATGRSLALLYIGTASGQSPATYANAEFASAAGPRAALPRLKESPVKEPLANAEFASAAGPRAALPRLTEPPVKESLANAEFASAAGPRAALPRLKEPPVKEPLAYAEFASAAGPRAALPRLKESSAFASEAGRAAQPRLKEPLVKESPQLFADGSGDRVVPLRRASLFDIRAQEWYDSLKHDRYDDGLCRLSNAALADRLALGKTPTLRAAATYDLIVRLQESRDETDHFWIAKRLLPVIAPLTVKSFYPIFRTLQTEDFKTAFIAYLQTNVIVTQTPEVDENSSVDTALLEGAFALNDTNTTALLYLGNPDVAAPYSAYAATAARLGESNRTIAQLHDDLRQLDPTFHAELIREYDGQMTERVETKLARRVQSDTQHRYAMALLTLIDLATLQTSEDNIADPEADSDGDGIKNGDEVLGAVPSDPRRADSDGDGLHDAADPCRTDADNGCLNGDLAVRDSDGDTIVDAIDNCPDFGNTEQADSDGDGIGDVCVQQLDLMFVSPKSAIRVFKNHAYTFEAQVLNAPVDALAITWTQDGTTVADAQITHAAERLSHTFFFDRVGTSRVCLEQAMLRGHCLNVTVLEYPRALPALTPVLISPAVAESVGTVQLELTLDTPSLTTASIRVTTVDETASAGSDYTAVQQTVTFAGGDRRAFVDLTILDDLTPEPDKSFLIRLGDARYVTPSPSELRITILDDDTETPTLPVLSFDSTRYDVDESVGQMLIGLSLNAPAATAITVQLFFEGNATLGVDYRLDSLLTLPAGATAAQLPVTIVDDDEAEGPERFNAHVEYIFDGLATLSDTAASALVRIADTDRRVVAPLPKTGRYTALYDFDDGHYRAGAEREFEPLEGEVIDHGSGLIWEDAPRIDGSGDYTWSEANAYCRSHSDTLQWRLPTPQELFFLTNKGNGIEGYAFDEGFRYFGGDGSEFWTSKRYYEGDEISATQAWSVRFSAQSILTLTPLDAQRNVRCVRNETDAVTLYAEPSRDGDILYDGISGLAWEDDPARPDRNAVFEEAIAACETLSFGGYDDWRLANIFELISLMSYDIRIPAIHPEFMTIEPSSSLLLSSTPSPDGTTVWTVDTITGAAELRSSVEPMNFRCVRGGEVE